MKKSKKSVQAIVGHKRWKMFSKPERRFLRDIAKARRLINRHCSQVDSDMLRDALNEAHDILTFVLKGLETADEKI